ncbi:MAG: hypothetical protein EA352_05690 [Gemmatimonadales bacterium]|nr:MAG: hypothetical protein EA352_05690 [Gemmatimonadales bacterium]
MGQEAEASPAAMVLDAFNASDAARVRLSRDGNVVVDVVEPLEPGSGETRLRIEVEVGPQAETLQLEVVLLFEGAPLFRGGNDAVVLRAGQTTTAEVPLLPLPDRVELESGPLVLTALEAEQLVAGQVVFATGDAFTDAVLDWRSDNPAAVEVDEAGRVRAVTPGQALVTATFQDLSASLVVQVEQAVASVLVAPDGSLVGIDEELVMEARLRDANGFHIPVEGRGVSWSSSNPLVASVDAAGVVVGLAEGVTVITATSEGASGEATVEVEEEVLPVEFPDLQLELAVRSALDLPTGDILPEDLLSLTVLVAFERGISDLRGLEGALNLDFLNLNLNLVQDLTPILELPITSLGLFGSPLSDPSQVSQLTSLVELNIGSTGATSIGFLESLAELQLLGVAGNDLVDLAPLSGLEGLVFLNVADNLVSDLSPLAGLSRLVQLGLGRNSVQDLNPLSGLLELEALFADSNLILDLSPLQDLGALRALQVAGNLIEDAGPVEAFTQLELLGLNGNQIDHVGPLRNLLQLESVFLAGNSITDLGPLVANSGLGDGDLVDVRGNPLGEQALCLDIPALIARGVQVQVSSGCPGYSGAAASGTEGADSHLGATGLESRLPASLRLGTFLQDSVSPRTLDLLGISP